MEEEEVSPPPVVVVELSDPPPDPPPHERMVNSEVITQMEHIRWFPACFDMKTPSQYFIPSICWSETHHCKKG